jgi:hypothetical protein
MVMQRRTRAQLSIIAALALTTIIPAFGVIGMIGVVLISLRTIGYAPTRRVQLSWVLAALPSPLSIGAALVAPLAWWERCALAMAFVMPWVPGEPSWRWGIVLLVAGIPIGITNTRLRVVSIVPVLQMAATREWPQGWDSFVLVLALCFVCVQLVRGERARLWDGIALALCALNSSAAIAVLPWVLVCIYVPLAVLEVWTWWGVIAAAASGGYGLLAGLAMIPLVQSLQRVIWRTGRWLVVIVVWCVLPVTSSVARLQTSLSPYGVLYSDNALAFADATQRIIAHFPWQVMGLVGVLLWAAWMQWNATVDHA